MGRGPEGIVTLRWRWPLVWLVIRWLTMVSRAWPPRVSNPDKSAAPTRSPIAVKRIAASAVAL